MRPPQEQGVLGRLEPGDDLAHVPLGEPQPALLGVRPRHRPQKPCPRHRVGDRGLDVEHVGEHGLGGRKPALVGVGAREVHAEPDHAADVDRRAQRLLQSRAQHRDGAGEVAGTGIGPSQRLVQGGPQPRGRGGLERARLLEQGHGPLVVALVDGELPEPLDGPALGVDVAARARLEREGLQRLGRILGPHPHAHLGQADPRRRDRSPGGSARQLGGRDAEPAGQLRQDARRWHPLPGLDPADVCRRASREGELLHRQSALGSHRTQPPTQRCGVVDVRRCRAAHGSKHTVGWLFCRWQLTKPAGVRYGVSLPGSTRLKERRDVRRQALAVIL